jgi:archaellin
VKWTRTVISTANDNNLLETGEQFEITISVDDLGDGRILNSGISANSKISIQVKPSAGSVITIVRRLPPAIEQVMDLY